MEYPFKDLLPQGEVTARDGYYKDWTHIDADTFHQISELMTFIREKGYGSDTREAIAQALERVYHDAAMSGNANMEVSMARGLFGTLSERLNNETFDMSRMGQDVKEAMTGGSVAVVGKNSTGTINLIDKAVTPAKTTFLNFQEGINRFNKQTIKVGGFYNTAGSWSAFSTANSSDFISVKEGDVVRYLSDGASSPVITQWNSTEEFVTGQTFASADYPSGSVIEFTISEPSVTKIKVSVLGVSLDTLMVTINQDMPPTYHEYDGGYLLSPEVKIKHQLESEIYTIRNLVKSGNFEDSNNWDGTTGVSIAGGVATFSAHGSLKFLTQSELWEAKSRTGHDIFISFEVLENSLVGNGAFGFNNLGADDFSSGVNINASVGTHTLVHKVRNGAGKDNRIAFSINGGFTSGNIKIKNVIVIDLTETFGSNQPNSSYLENLIKEKGGYFSNLSSSDILKNEVVKLSQNWGTYHGNLSPVEGETFDFNEAVMDGYGYSYSTRRNIVNAPENRNVDNAFYYWSYLHESGSNKFINQFYIDAITGEMWLRNSVINSTGSLSTLSGWVKIGGDEHEDSYQKIQGIGDSIMYGLPDTGSGRLANPWISQIASHFNSDVINLGISSSTIATNNSGDNPTFNNGDRNPIVERLDALDTSADLTILEGGINDFWIGVPLGDFDSRDTDTFYGALHAYYGGVAEMLHDKQVVVMTCLQSTTSNPNGVSLYDWTRAQVEVANYYSLPVFDAYSEAGISPRVSSQKTKYMNDGLHLSQAGADRLSERFISYL